MATDDNTEVITYTPYILSLLRRLQSSRSLLSVQIDSQSDLCSSAMIDVDASHDTYYLDELNPLSGHAEVKKGTQLHIHGRLQGVHMVFKSTVQEVQTDNSIALYKMAFPEQILYRQRRRHFRATLNSKQATPVILKSERGADIPGVIVDISAGGLCSRINYDDSSGLEESQSIENVRLILNRRSVTCDLELRSIRHYPDKGFSLIGGEFLDILPGQQQHLERFVASIDRSKRRITNL